MKIAAINVYRVELPGDEARHISGGRVIAGQDSTVVELRTDTAQVGWGESCPFGPAYLPAFAEGVRAGIGVVAEALLGADPTNVRRVRRILDAAIAHLAHTVAPSDLLSIWNPATMITVETARGLRDTRDSAHLRAGSDPGLGIEVFPSVLGAPVATYG